MLRVIAIALLAGIGAEVALSAPATVVNSYEVEQSRRWLVPLVATAGGAYLALARETWGRRVAVFGTTTLAFGVLFFAATDWHTRADGPAYECFTHPPYSMRFEGVHVQRVPPGVRCESGTESFLVRPDAQDWLILLGESAAAGLAATGPVLWLLGLPRRRMLPRVTREAAT